MSLGSPSATPVLAPPSVFDDLLVVLAVLGRNCAGDVVAALEQAGVSVRVTSNLAEARCSTARFLSRATVVVDPPAITESIHAGLGVLSRQGAVLVRVAGATTQERIDLLNSGADSVLASVDPGEVVAALGAVLRRTRTSTRKDVPQVVCAGEICVHLDHRTATAAGRSLALTPLEFDLLAYLVLHAGEALSRDRLLEDVWGYEIGGRETVTVHVRRLRRKLEADPSRPTRLQTVWGIGYRLNPDVTTGPVAAEDAC